MSGLETLQIIPESVAHAAAYWIYVDATINLIVAIIGFGLTFGLFYLLFLFIKEEEEKK